MSPSWQSLAGEATEQRDLARRVAVCLEQENAELRRALNDAGITVPDEDAQIRSYLPEGEAPF
jgi:hypothetical protein